MLTQDPELPKKRTRLIVQRGIENFAIRVEEIAFVYTEKKIFYVIDHCGMKYICDKNLSELENELDQSLFFRANRQYLININFVRAFKPLQKVKLQVELKLPASSHAIIVSQETAPLFKRWIYEE